MLTSGPAGTKATEVAIDTMQAHARSVLEELRKVGFTREEARHWNEVWDQGLERIHADLAIHLQNHVHEGKGVLAGHITGEIDRSLRQCREDLSLFIAGVESMERAKTRSWKRDITMVLIGVAAGQLPRAVEVALRLF